MSKIEKAYAITDAKISFVSLVDKAANKKLLLVLAVAVLGGGAAFYFKVYRPKQQAATEPEEDYGEELEDYDGEEDGPPWDEDEDENEDTEDGE